MLRKLLAVSAAMLLAAMLPYCSSSSSPTPTTTTTTTLPPCTQSTVLQVSGPVPSDTLVGQTFNTTTTGRLDVTVDWTFASSTIGIYVVPQNNCTTVDQFNARTCNFIVRSEPGGAKPRKVSAPNVAAGAYDLLVANFSDVDESASGQVVLSSPSCPAATSGEGRGGAEAGPRVRNVRRW